MLKNFNRDKVAIVYHYWAHYRASIVNALCHQQSPLPEYVLYSGKESNNDIKTIDPKLSQLPVSEGGLNWRFLRNIWITKDILWQTGLIKLALSNEFDTIIYLGQMYFISTWISVCLARLTGKRILMWTHGFLREKTSIKERIRCNFYKLADGILLYGNRARLIMIQKGFDPKKLYVVYNSLYYCLQKQLRDQITDADLISCRKSLFSFPDLPILLFVGRLTPQKRLDMLAYSAFELGKRNLNVNVLFVGDGLERKMLEDLCIKLGIKERVVFYGACHDEDKLSLLITMSDLCIAPGEVGLTAMHSLAYGTPVITHDNFSMQMPEYEAIQDGISGKFFRHGDNKDLTLTIENWLLAKKQKAEVMHDCIEIIEKHYNPEYQAKIINDAVLGVPAVSE